MSRGEYTVRWVLCDASGCQHQVEDDEAGDWARKGDKDYCPDHAYIATRVLP